MLNAFTLDCSREPQRAARGALCCVLAALLACLSLIGLADFSAARAQSASDFQLPPDTAASNAPEATGEEPAVQGPVDLEGPVPIAPRTIAPDEAENPAPTAPNPSENRQSDPASGAASSPASPAVQSGTADSANEPGETEPAGTTQPPRGVPAAQPPIREAIGSSASGAAASRSPAAQNGPAGAEPAGPMRFRLPPAAPLEGTDGAPERAPLSDAETRGAQPQGGQEAAATSQESRQSAPGLTAVPNAGSSLLDFWPAILGALLAMMAVFWLVRGMGEAKTPVIKPPRNRQVMDLGGHLADASGIKVKLEPTSFSRSIMNATLTYRVTLRNDALEALNDLAVEAELICAGPDLALSDQIADPQTALPLLHQADRLASGQSVRFNGTVQMPMSKVSFFLQGKTALLIPLLRMRIAARQLDPIAKTYVIGQMGADTLSKPQPFPMDEGPRSWSPVTYREIDKTHQTKPAEGAGLD